MAEHTDKPYRGDYPDVHDEAANSPRWLPAVGFAILCLLGLFVAYRAATAHEEARASEQATEAEGTAEEAAAEAPAAEAPAAEAPGADEGKPPEE
jgi:hypothetical protein